jgi:plastocyanin
MMDACDPTTFGAAGVDCIRNGGVSFDEFLAQLEQNGKVGAWHFAPPEMNVRVGQTLVAVNRGGEVHTFTEVEHFGGGFIPELNGGVAPAPECVFPPDGTLSGDDFVPPGGTKSEEVEEEGTELYQCCIHPWMRTVVHVHGS